MQTIREQRQKQGMKSRELAQRLGVSPARVSVLERDEQRGGITLAMLQRAAEALDCQLEYRLVPNPGAKPRLRLVSTDAEGGYDVREE